MTKEHYFEMCKVMHSDPVDDEIPLELNDFPIIVQQAFIIYESLIDEWEYMNGNYVGKRFDYLFNVLHLYEIDTREEQLLVYNIISIIDGVRKKLIKEKNTT